MSAAPLERTRILAPDNIELPAGAGSRLAGAMLFIGISLVIVAALGGMGDAIAAKASLAAIHAGFLTAIGWPIGALGFILILHLVKSGWSATSRRQFEHIMSLMPVGAAIFAGIIVLQVIYLAVAKADEPQPYLWSWMDRSVVEHDAIFQAKAPFLNLWRFGVANILYFVIWIGLAGAMWSLSRRQDADGDKWHSATAVRIAAPGILLYAFSVAFAGFDWIMALDYKWFSTMLGVYFFAVSIGAGLALGTSVLIILRKLGRLHGVFTAEHQHDLGKLVFAYVVFWAYIAFSQYFLIWYANMPEETAFFMQRKGEFGGPGADMWAALSWIVPIAKFIVPFIILLPRPSRRRPGLLLAACAWILIMQIVEMYWMVRPVAGAGFRWTDVAGGLGPPLIMLGMLARRISHAPLIAVNDPRLDEALHHRNTI